ncbi:MAG: PDZ domain-containing protein [Gammaproteobacteria bacterium]
MRSAILALCSMGILFLSACATNPYTKFYHDRLDGKTLSQIPYIDASPCKPRVFGSHDLKTDAHTLYERNYALIGESAFQGPPQDNSKVIKQAEKVGACVVLLHSDYLGTQTTYMPWITPNAPQTSNTTVTGDINATATTTTYGGAHTTYIPRSVSEYTYEAAFFAKYKPPIFGVLTTNLTPELREKLQRNTGAYVAVVIDNSPAYDANILEGDVITSFSGEEVTSGAQFMQLIHKHAGERVHIILIRDGTTKEFNIQSNKSSY